MRVWCAFAYLFRLGLRLVAFEACSAAPGLQRNVQPECGRKRLEGARGGVLAATAGGAAWGRGAQGQSERRGHEPKTMNVCRAGGRFNQPPRGRP